MYGPDLYPDDRLLGGVQLSEQEAGIGRSWNDGDGGAEVAALGELETPEHPQGASAH